MRSEEKEMHLRAGRFFGKLPTCGEKIDYKSEKSAAKAAKEMTAKFGGLKEAYPCYWCSGWHIGRKMTEKERKIFSSPDQVEDLGEGEYMEMNVAEPVFGMQVGKRMMRIHHKSICEGEYCSVHNPSDHKLKNAPLNWRGDLRIMERFCDHGVGHPDPDDAAFRRRTQGSKYIGTVHSCDGCC